VQGKKVSTDIEKGRTVESRAALFLPAAASSYRFASCNGKSNVTNPPGPTGRETLPRMADISRWNRASTRFITILYNDIRKGAVNESARAGWFAGARFVPVDGEWTGFRPRESGVSQSGGYKGSIRKEP